MELIIAKIEFALDEKRYKFTIIHNLPDIEGLSIEDALRNWVKRTKKFTDRSFVNYINSKGTEYIAMTEKQYNKLIEENRNER